MSGPFFVCRHECVSQAGRSSRHCLAYRCGPIWPWPIGDPAGCQGFRAKSLGEATLSAHDQRSMRFGGIPAFSGVAAATPLKAGMPPNRIDL